MKVINEILWDLINSIAPANGFITGIFPDEDAEILYENGYRSTDGEKIKNEFPVEDRLNGIVVKRIGRKRGRINVF